MSGRSKPFLYEQWEQDMMFIEAMAEAVAQGLEYPPMLGIDTRPCTRNPMFVPLRINSPGIRSSAGDTTEGGNS